MITLPALVWSAVVQALLVVFLSCWKPSDSKPVFQYSECFQSVLLIFMPVLPPLLPAPPSDQSYIILFGRYVGGRKIVSSFKYPVTTQLSISVRRKEWCIRVLVNPGGLQEVVTEVLFFNFCLFVLFICSTFSTCHLFLLGLYIFFSELSNLFSNGNSPVLQRLPRIFIRF